MDCFLAFHGVGEIIVRHAAVTGAILPAAREHSMGPHDVKAGDSPLMMTA